MRVLNNKIYYSLFIISKCRKIRAKCLDFLSVWKEKINILTRILLFQNSYQIRGLNPWIRRSNYILSWNYANTPKIRHSELKKMYYCRSCLMKLFSSRVFRFQRTARGLLKKKDQIYYLINHTMSYSNIIDVLKFLTQK